MKKFIMYTLLLMAFSNIQAQDKKNEKVYQFEILTEVPHTDVRSQDRSGTCWSFAGTAFVEAEILRIKNLKLDLSEMFNVRYAYHNKAEKLVRLHGNLNMGPGGGFSDVLGVIEQFGMIPENDYSGRVIGEENHIHGEMDAVFEAYTSAVMKNKNRKLTPVWLNGFDCLLNTYLGSVPNEFTFDGKSYSPKSFAAFSGFQPADYIELGSYTHHPYHEAFILEIPDNWMWSEITNLKLDEMMATIDHALKKGYVVGWDADVSDKGFSWKNGVAIVPEDEPSKFMGAIMDSLAGLSKKEREKKLFAFEDLVQEKEITAELRQTSFNNYETTDDHLMLIVGIAKDQKGNKYYKVKNSWGTEDHVYEGYFFASEAFVAYKTISILVHKEAVPKAVKTAIGL
ncbi:MAG: C1 family peptidase [Bacteroidales bacterium]|nr:C1 family peptidase [Bacteroidales bacterium]